jgi:hypothetical protein
VGAVPSHTDRRLVRRINDLIAVVVVSLAEYQSMKETEYLLCNPNNAAALRRSIAELERGTPPRGSSLTPTTSGISPEGSPADE